MDKHIKFIGILFVLSTFLFTGCSKIGSNPKNALSKYLDASLHGKHEEAYQCISEKDKETKDLQEYLAEQAGEESPFAQALASKISYEIKEVTVTGNQAKAEIAVTTPDFGSIFTDIMGVAFMSAFGDEKNEKEVEKMLAEKYKAKEIPMTTTTQSFDLVEESDGWKVFFNWEIKEKIDETMKQAEQLEKEKKLYAAKEKYQEVLELDSKSVEASQKIKDMDKEIEGFKEKQAYIDKVEIRDVHIGKSVLDEMGVFGEIKNLGDRTLTKVQITIYCLDKNGKAVFEKTYHPVLISEYSLFGDNKPLKPNYSEKFGVKLDDAPSDWANKVRVKVTDIEFEK